MNSPVSVLTNLRQDRLQRSKMKQTNQLVHTSAVRSSRYEAETQEASVALGNASSNSYASFVLSKLPACFISR